jgi:hypothetical protein
MLGIVKRFYNIDATQQIWVRIGTCRYSITKTCTVFNGRYISLIDKLSLHTPASLPLSFDRKAMRQTTGWNAV